MPASLPPEGVLPEAMIEQFQQEMYLQSHPDQAQARTDIEELVNEVRRCQTLADYRAVQQKLGKHIERVDAAANEAHVRQAHHSNRVRRLGRRTTPAVPSEMAAHTTELEQAEFDRELYLSLGRQYRTVGDAMAWQLYDFSTVILYALGMNPSGGPLGRKSGVAAEEACCEEVWRTRGAFALRHDFTNCLRVWDLSIFSRDQPAEIAEVKVGGRHISGKQKRQADSAIELARYHVCTKPSGDLLVHSAHPPALPDGPTQSNMPILLSAICQAGQDGVGFAHNLYLAVSAVNLLHPDIQQPDDAMRARVARFRDIPPEISDPPCMDYLHADSGTKMRRAWFGAPYTIYPLPPAHVALICTGFLRFRVQLNTAAVTRAFRAKGFNAECLLGEAGAGPDYKPSGSYFRVWRGDARVTVHDLPIEQLLFEGLTIEDLVATVTAGLRTASARKLLIERGLWVPGRPRYPTRQHGALATHIGLENIWRASRDFVSDENSR